MVVFSVYIYGIESITKFRWKNGFLRGFHGTPLCTNGSVGYLMQLGVKIHAGYHITISVQKLKIYNVFFKF